MGYCGGGVCVEASDGGIDRLVVVGGEGYAEKLRAAGVTVTARRYPSLVHGYLSLTGYFPATRAPWNDLVTALRAALK